MSPIFARSSGLVLALSLAVTATAASAQQNPIRFGVGVDAAYAPVFLAKREKLFEKHGVNVDVVQYTQGGDAADAVLAGQAELVGSSEAVLLNRATRGDIKGAVIFEQSGRYLKLAARSGINDVKDIKKWGMVPGSVSEYVNKDQVTKVAKALDEACKMIAADPSKAGTATQAEAKIPAAVAEAQFKEIECVVRDFTDQDLVNYKEMAQFLNEKGVTKSRADVEKFTLKGFYK